MLGLYVDDIDRKTYHINCDHKAVFDAFNSGHSKSTYLTRFREQTQDDKAIVLKRTYPIGDEIVVAFGFNPNRPDQGTTLATVAYSKSPWGLYPSERASGTRDSVVNDIIGRCPAGKEPIEKTEMKELTDHTPEPRLVFLPHYLGLGAVLASFAYRQRDTRL